MVAPDEVTIAFRIILGRAPESDAEIDALCAADDLQTLGRKLLSTKEFASRNRRERPLNYVSLTGDPPVPLVAPTAIKGSSRICRQADFSVDAFRYWTTRMHLLPQGLHRKVWE